MDNAYIPKVKEDLTRLKRVFFFTLLFGLAAHAYVYFNLVQSHDGCEIIQADHWSYIYIQAGRFLLPIYYILRGDYQVPWLIGLLSLVFLALSAYLVASLLNIRKPVLLAALCGIFTVNITIIANNATYLYAADPYCLALLFSCLGAWLWQRCPKWGFVPAAGCFVLSLGLYQAYIDVAIGLALLLIIWKLAQGRSLASLWKWALKCAVSLLAGIGLWYLMTVLVQHLMHVPMSTDYNRPTLVLEAGLLARLRLIPLAYWEVVRYFVGYDSYVTTLVRTCNILLGLAGGFLWIRMLRRQRVHGLELAALLVCVALMPLGLNLMCLLTDWVHELMIFSYLLLYVALLIPLEQMDPPKSPSERIPALCRGAILCLLALLVVRNVRFANGAYFYKQMVTESSLLHAHTILTEMEKQDGYEAGFTPVATIGLPGDSDFKWSSDAFLEYQDLVGLWRDTTSFPSTLNMHDFCLTRLGQDINFADDLTTEQISALPTVQQMPVYPQDGYCQMIDGVMVIKFIQ